MRAKSNKGILPPELARKISPSLVNTAEAAGAVGKSTLTAVGAFFLYGPTPGMAGNSFHNGFLYLLGSWVCPGLAALFWSAMLAARRFRIYRGNPVIGPMTYVDTGNDPVTMRLAEICNSKEARRHVRREALKLSIILFAILGTAAFLLRDSLNWDYPSAQNHFLYNPKPGESGVWFWLGPFACFFVMLFILGIDFQRSCLMTWAKRETAHQVVKQSYSG